MSKNRSFFNAFILILIVILILATSLFYKQINGVSDNGDYSRVTYPNRISYIEGEKEWFVFTDSFKIDFKGESNIDKLFNAVFTFDFKYVTTHHVFIKISIILNTIVRFLKSNDFGLYNIRWLGITYSIFFVLAFGIIFFNYKTKRKWLDIVFFLLLIFVFCDLGYTIYFNSFFGEAAQFVSFIFIVGSVIGAIYTKKRRKLFYLSYYLFVILFMGSKFANIPSGVILAFTGLAFILFDKKNKSTKLMVSAMLIISIFSSIFIYANVPKWMEGHNNYHAVFFGILKDSPNPEKDLKDLGLPEYMIELKNTNYFVEDLKVDIHSEKFKKDFNITKMDLVKYYITHPKTLWREIEVSCKNSSIIGPCYLSNYKDDERMVFTDSYSPWSSLRQKLPLDNIYVIIIIFLFGLLILVYEYLRLIKKNHMREKGIAILLFSISLWLINGINLAMPVMGNGEADLAKHMYAFITGFDLMIVLELVWLINRLSDSKDLLESLKGKAHAIIKKRVVILALIVIISIVGVLVKGIYYSGNDNVNISASSKTTLRVGAYLSLGEYNNNKLLWRVINTDENGILILSEKQLESKAFDVASSSGDENRKKYGSNLWEESDMRGWLNNDFLRGFNSDELDTIKTYKNKVLLSKYDKQNAEGGTMELYWIHLPEFVNRGYDDAYCEYTDDKIFLLDVEQFNKYVFNNKIEYKLDNKYWLETAYYNNSSMVRIVDTDGFVYMKDANVNNVGVLPAAYIDDDLIVTEGSGSKRRPYKLRKDASYESSKGRDSK